MNGNEPATRWERVAFRVMLAVAILNFVYWAFLGLPDQGWSRVALATFWGVLALVCGATIFRSRT